MPQVHFSVQLQSAPSVVGVCSLFGGLGKPEKADGPPRRIFTAPALKQNGLATLLQPVQHWYSVRGITILATVRATRQKESPNHIRWRNSRAACPVARRFEAPAAKRSARPEKPFKNPKVA